MKGTEQVAGSPQVFLEQLWRGTILLCHEERVSSES